MGTVTKSTTATTMTTMATAMAMLANMNTATATTVIPITIATPYAVGTTSTICIYRQDWPSATGFLLAWSVS
jgi:hypothetical protein